MKNVLRNLTRWLGVAAALAAGFLALGVAEAQGSLIAAVGTAQPVVGGQYSGWYEYTYQVTWDLTKSLSHIDILLPSATSNPNLQIVFAGDIDGLADGLSTNSSYHEGQTPVLSVDFEGEYNTNGDPSISLTTPVAKWDPIGPGNPGEVGYGEFSFYANVAPQTVTLLDDFVAAKYGQNTIYGDLSGVYPSDLDGGHMPEPATLAFLGVGVAGVAAFRLRGQRRGL